MTTESIRVLRTGTCPSLTGKSRLTFEIGADDSSGIHLRVVKNTGAGMFNKSWVALQDVHRLVKNDPITSGTLAPLFRGGSANSAGFLLAVMRHEGLVRKAGESRAYERLDGAAFFSGVQAALGTSAMGVAKATGKAAKAGQPGDKASPTARTPGEAPGKAPTKPRSKAPEPEVAPAAKRPAVYVTEVHGPLPCATKKARPKR